MVESAKKILLTLGITFSFFLWGCNDINTEKYDLLKIGMNNDEVIAILGKAEKCEGAMGIKSCTWVDDEKNIHVAFAGDRVVGFSGHGL